ncbi:metallophosphoesterase family protein [Longivirga aurantiaca]|uniref:Metallophosphoesterase n=1 Tax=Longivirga aurantiaca TaxID=1837743 RepID=A0ABW1T3U2_9ACTN
MRVHVVSDVHARTDALARSGDGADALICLGDLVLFLDYEDFHQGIFPTLFGAERTRTFVELRTAGRFEDARSLASGWWDQVIAAEGRERHTLVQELVDAQYAEMFAAMPTPAYLTYGNVDLPALWARHLRPGHTVLDGEVADIGGLRFGFVGGGLLSPMRTPYELDEDSFAAKVEALGEVDVLCAHIPPALPELCYDVVARRFEVGSRAILEHVRRTQPRAVLFGHVHQPLARRARIGRTECVNVGHFRAGRTPFALSW